MSSGTRASIGSHATVLLVDDVERALDYYRDRLGFEGHAWEVNPTHYAYVSRGNCHVHFACFANAGPRPNSEAVPPDMFDLYIYVDDVEALHNELRERGADIISAPVDTTYGLREIRVRDPHGYVLAFGSSSGNTGARTPQIAKVAVDRTSEFATRTGASAPGLGNDDLRTVSDTKGGCFMAGAVTHSLVHQFAAMKPTEFGATIEPKWQVADKLVKEVRMAVEKQQLTPLDGARVISSIAATLFGYDEFILREISPESLLSAPSRR